MIDPSVLMSAAPIQGVGTPPVQTLPPAQSHDIMRFEDVMSGKVDLSTLKSNPNDQSVLQLVEPTTGTESTSFKDLVINKLTSMDDSYSTILKQLSNHPQFSDYLNTNGVNGNSSSMLTYPAVEPSIDGSDPYKVALQDLQKTQDAALSYQKDTTSWTFGAQMWSTTINLASAVVNQVAQGFKTLFRASG